MEHFEDWTDEQIVTEILRADEDMERARRRFYALVTEGAHRGTIPHRRIYVGLRLTKRTWYKVLERARHAVDVGLAG